MNNSHVTANVSPVDVRRTIGRLAACLVLLTSSAVAASASNSDDPAPPKFHISFDDTAVRSLIDLIKARDVSDASLNRWLDLPANKYLLSVGSLEHNLTRDQLKQNAIAVIQGTATEESQPPDDMGCLRMTSTESFAKMLDRLESTESDRVALITDRLIGFAPKGTAIDETVYVHLGGDWDAVNDHGNIYLNMRFWHDGRRPGWDGLNMIVAHETTHSVQTAAYGNPQVQTDGPGAFLTTLSKIQREGTARYVEFDTDEGAYLPDTYGFYERAIDTETFRSFRADMALLQPVFDACYPAFDHAKFVKAYTTGIDSGGPFYDIGYGMAKAIDEHRGRPALIQTIIHGPKMFFSEYNAVSAADRQLPKLPPDIVQAVSEMPEKLPD